MLTHAENSSKLLNSHLACPLCPSTDAYAEYDDGHGYCFSCEGYVASETSSTEKSTAYTYEYVPWRGINRQTLQTYDASTKCDAVGKPISMGFRYPNGDYQVRQLDQKRFYWVKGDSKEPHGLFGRDKFAAGSHRDVIITEGAIDAQSLHQVLHVPCVSVVSASTAVTDCTVDRSYLNSFERIYLAFDSDTPGREAVQRVARLFDYSKVWQLKFSNRKDANEYLEAGEENDLRNIYANSRRYLPETILSGFDEFDRVLVEEPKLGVPYPFSTLNDLTKGIRLGESVLITAQEGIGKTELMHAIEYSILENTNANVGAIFLEELPRRHLQALAGIHLKAAVHLPDSGYTTDQVRNAIRDIIGKDERLFLYRNFGSDDPEVLLDSIRLLVAGRNCNYILLDHITMVVSGAASEDERRSLDHFSTKLEMMVKELNYALIVVSHVNDFGQTRGSRYISKIADVRIDAERDLRAISEIDRRTIHLTVSKNRPAWKTGAAGHYIFDPLTNSYTETQDGCSEDERTHGIGHESSQASIPYIPSPPHQAGGSVVDTYDAIFNS